MASSNRGRSLIERASPRPKGRLYEDFQAGQAFEHHWGRTITESEALQFTTLTCNSNPLYFNRVYAAEHGHRDIVVNPLLVFNTIFGMSVEDLSEIGGPFVGVNELRYGVTVYPGDTLLARSTTLHCRLSKSKPDIGLVTWHTSGVNQNGERVVDFQRTNVVRRRAARRNKL